MSECGIYAWMDAETGECLYVGKTANLESRERQHLYMLRSGRHLLGFNEWFQEVGTDETRLCFTVLERLDPDPADVSAAELHWFEKLSPKFYGMKPDKNGAWTHTEKSRAQISKGLTFRPKPSLDVEEVLDRYANGESATAIANSLCEPTFHILSLLHELGVVRSSSENNKSRAKLRKTENHVPFSERVPEIEELARLYFDEELSGTEISRMFDVTPSYVVRLLRKEGYMTRSRAEAAGLSRRKQDGDRVAAGPTKEWLSEQYHSLNRSIASIAEELGWTEGRVRYRIILLGVGMKSRGIEDWSGSAGDARRQLIAKQTAEKLSKLPSSDDLRRLYEAQLYSLREIGSEYGVSKNIVEKALRNANIHVRTAEEQRKASGTRQSMKAFSQSPTREELEDAYLLRGLSPKRIANEFGVSAEVVRYRLDKHGIKPRGRC